MAALLQGGPSFLLISIVVFSYATMVLFELGLRHIFGLGVSANALQFLALSAPCHVDGHLFAHAHVKKH